MSNSNCGEVVITNSKTEKENNKFKFLIPEFYPIVKTSYYFRHFLIYDLECHNIKKKKKKHSVDFQIIILIR